MWVRKFDPNFVNHNGYLKIEIDLDISATLIKFGCSSEGFSSQKLESIVVVSK